MLRKLISSIIFVFILIYNTSVISKDVYYEKKKNNLINTYYNYNENNLSDKEFILEINSIDIKEYISLNDNLSNGFEVIKIDTSLVISGHSGLDVHLPFNKLNNLLIGDIIKIIYKDKIIEYKIEMVEYFDKNTYVNLRKDNYLYMITCDKYDLKKQLLISSKMQKVAKICIF